MFPRINFNIFVISLTQIFCRYCHILPAKRNTLMALPNLYSKSTYFLRIPNWARSSSLTCTIMPMPRLHT